VKLPRRKKKKAAPKRKCKTVRLKNGRRKRVCKPAPKKRKPAPRKPKAAPIPKPLANLPVPSAAAPPATAPPAPAPAPAPAAQAPAPAPPAPEPVPPRETLPAPPTPVVGHFDRSDAERLLWRAGFGPRSGQAEALAGSDPREAVRALTRVSGAAPLTGASAPRDENGNPIDPHNAWGHDHAWWLDRMVRSEHQLVERMTLIWHDWWATTNSDVQTDLMLAQNETFRRHALGSFEDLALAMTTDPAMLVFLNGIDNRRGRPNENYARELMELFTLGADRGAYTETDVRELARALTGWRASWSDAEGMHDFRFDPNRHDATNKTLWAGTPYQRTGAFGWRDAVRLCLENPFHRSFFVRKLWSYFIPTPPDADTQAALEGLYHNSGYQIRPVVEAILLHPDLYDGPPLVKPPAVYTAGLLRARGRGITTSAWAWLCGNSGQQLFSPPNVSGWNDNGWLDTSTVRGRWYIAYEILNREYVQPGSYSATETPEQAIAAALEFWGRPTLSAETLAELDRYARAAVPSTTPSWHQGTFRGYRQNALRHLVATCPDFQTS
jgi:uncharacterized protein (DUF1800 family)